MVQIQRMATVDSKEVALVANAVAARRWCVCVWAGGGAFAALPQPQEGPNTNGASPQALVLTGWG
jgi:hypothetical protein